MVIFRTGKALLNVYPALISIKSLTTSTKLYPYISGQTTTYTYLNNDFRKIHSHAIFFYIQKWTSIRYSIAEAHRRWKGSSQSHYRQYSAFDTATYQWFACLVAQSTAGKNLNWLESVHFQLQQWSILSFNIIHIAIGNKDDGNRIVATIWYHPFVHLHIVYRTFGNWQSRYH